jgi:hypothetical protein
MISERGRRIALALLTAISIGGVALAFRAYLSADNVIDLLSLGGLCT